MQGTTKSRGLLTSLIGFVFSAVCFVWMSAARDHSSVDHESILLDASFLSSFSDGNFTHFPQNFNSSRQEVYRLANSNGAIFTFVLIIVIVAYGLYYSYTHRASAAMQSESLSNVAKVPSRLSENMNNLVEQQVSSSYTSNPMDWLSSSRTLSTAKSPMSLLGAGLSIEAIGVLILAWLVLSTAIISVTARWPPGAAFFFIINAGLGRGFSIATPYGADTTAGQVAASNTHRGRETEADANRCRRAAFSPFRDPCTGAGIRAAHADRFRASKRLGWGGRGWVHHERTRARAHTHTLSQTHISGFRSPGRLKTTHRASRARATAGLLRRRPPVASEGGGGERRRGRARPPSSSLPRRESPPPAGPPCSRAHCGVRQAATIANEEREEGIMTEGRGDQERGKRGS